MNKAAFASHALEIERLGHLLWHYETVNVDQRQALERQQQQRDSLLSRIREQEKFIKSLQKRNKTLEATLKFERIASEGVKKRSTGFEADALAAQELSAHHRDKAALFEEELESLRLQVQQERVNRLQLLHEKESVADRLSAAERALSALETDNREVAQRHLDALQRLETALLQNESAAALLGVQSEEIARLGGEVERLTSRVAASTTSLLDEEAQHAKYLCRMDLLQQEISFLRKQLAMHSSARNNTNTNTNTNNNIFNSNNSSGSIMSLSLTQTEKSWSTFQPSNKSERENAVTHAVNRITAARHGDSAFCETNVFSQRNAQAAAPTHEERMAATQDEVLAKSRARKSSKRTDSLANRKHSYYATMNAAEQPPPCGGESESEFSSSVSSSQAHTLFSPLATPHRTARTPFDHNRAQSQSRGAVMSDSLRLTNVHTMR